jgi:tetratricopeptide (TPR) repeat protein
VSLGQVDKALLDFDQALVLSQSNDLAKGWRGLVLMLKGQGAEGLVDVNSALDKNPNNQAAQLGRGLSLLTTGQFDRAVVSFDQLVGKMADDTLARLLRARALLALKKPTDAMADLNHVLTVRPGFPDALAVRGIAWSAMLEYGKARDDLDRAISQKETVESYFARAKVYEAQNNPKKATDDFRRATELTPGSVFDVLAQAESKRKIQELSKRLPCGSNGQTATCL